MVNYEHSHIILLPLGFFSRFWHFICFVFGIARFNIFLPFFFLLVHINSSFFFVFVRSNPLLWWPVFHVWVKVVVGISYENHFTRVYLHYKCYPVWTYVCDCVYVFCRPRHLLDNNFHYCIFSLLHRLYCSQFTVCYGLFSLTGLQWFFFVCYLISFSISTIFYLYRLPTTEFQTLISKFIIVSLFIVLCTHLFNRRLLFHHHFSIMFRLLWLFFTVRKS